MRIGQELLVYIRVDCSGHYMIAHAHVEANPDVEIFAITSPEESHESCMQFIFNVNVRVDYNKNVKINCSSISE